MSILKKPDGKSVGVGAVQIGAGAIGAMASKGVVTFMPEDWGIGRKIGIAAIALLAAGSINPTTTTGSAVQAAFLGMGIQQGADALSEAIKPSVDVQDNNTATGKFLNAVLGNDTASLPASDAELASRLALGQAQWESAEPVENGGDLWTRPAAAAIPSAASYL